MLADGGTGARRGAWWFTTVRVPELFLALLVMVLVVFLTLSVVMRYVFDIGIEWSDELARMLFVWVVFVGFAVAIRHRGNVGVEVLLDRMSAPARRAMIVAQDVAILVFSLFFVWQAVVTVRFSLMQRLPVMQVTIAWLYAAVLAAGVLMVVYAVGNLADSLRGRTRDAHPDAEGGEALRHSE